MAIRVLLDHGVPRPSIPPPRTSLTIPESHIIFLAYLIARRGLLSVHRAFPEVKIVTAAIDTGLDEMHFPLSTLVMGEAVGEEDIATRLVGENEDADEDDEDDDEMVKTQEEMSSEGFRIPVKKGTEDLKFSRKKRTESTVREKRAWVVSPGMDQVSYANGIELILLVARRYGTHRVCHL